MLEDENLLCSMGITCLSERYFFYANNLFFNHRISEWFELEVKIISGFAESQLGYTRGKQPSGNVLMDSTVYKAIHRNVSAALVCCWILP